MATLSISFVTGTVTQAASQNKVNIPIAAHKNVVFCFLEQGKDLNETGSGSRYYNYFTNLADDGTYSYRYFYSSSAANRVKQSYNYTNFDDGSKTLNLTLNSPSSAQTCYYIIGVVPATYYEEV